MEVVYKGGACYIREDIICHEPDLNHRSIDLELLTVSILLQDQRKYFLCTCIVYCPTIGNYTVAFNKLTDVM